MNWLLNRIKGDNVIWGAILLLSLLSILAIYSSTKMLAESARDGDTMYYVLKQFAMLGIGFVIIYFAHKINYKFYSGFSKVLLPISLLLLLLTYMFGIEINSAVRWLRIPGTGLTFQTSDIAKLGLIMFLARTIAKKQDEIKDFKKGFLPLMIPILVICLVILPSDFSTSAMLLATSIGLLFIGGAEVKHIGIVLLAAIVGFFILIGLAEIFDWDFLRLSTWISRLNAFFGEDAFQTQQAKIAIAQGKWFGVGPGNNIQGRFLPGPYGDFIFAIIIEEYGFFGGFLIVFLYLLLLHRSIRILIQTPNSFGALLAVGLTILLVIQAFLHMAVVVDLLPNTGLSLPLVSMGGTSTVFTCFALGVILSVSAHSEKPETAK
ncbi:MAG: FtsW/RodA/SpoVE family cell cycle protein [Bacteroidia bacterium]